MPFDLADGRDDLAQCQDHALPHTKKNKGYERVSEKRKKKINATTILSLSIFPTLSLSNDTKLIRNYHVGGQFHNRQLMKIGLIFHVVV
jgi:hypothetical protein